MGAAQPESTSAGIMRARWLNHGKIRNLESLTHEACDANAVVVDALFGTGLSRPIDKTATRALEIGSRNGRLITVDILSGVNSDTGEFLADGDTGIRSSNCTVTFECPKIGHYLGSGGMLSGDIRVVPLGLESELDQLDALERTPRLFRFPESRYFDSLAKHPNRHKYQHGHLVVVSGGPGRGGAARLAARAALRIGTGLVTVAAHTDAIAEHAAQLNAIMLADVSSSDSLRLLLSDERINAVCIGPGLGTGPFAKKLVFAAFSCNQNVILDADALTAFVGDPNELFALANGRSVLTPHIGEFRRLFPDLASEMSSGSNFSKIDAARAAADRSGCVILLKGADTVVAKPGHAARLVASTGRFSAPWLATAGVGRCAVRNDFGFGGAGRGTNGRRGVRGLDSLRGGAQSGPRPNRRGHSRWFARPVRAIRTKRGVFAVTIRKLNCKRMAVFRRGASIGESFVEMRIDTSGIAWQVRIRDTKRKSHLYKFSLETFLAHTNHNW